MEFTPIRRNPYFSGILSAIEDDDVDDAMPPGVAILILVESFLQSN